jgi:hypothetical protein
MSSGGGLGGLLDEAGNRRRQLGTIALPERQAVIGNTQGFFGTSSDRIVETDALDEAAIATIARVGNNDVVERALLGATAGKANYNHCVVFRNQKKGKIIARKHGKTIPVFGFFRQVRQSRQKNRRARCITSRRKLRGLTIMAAARLELRT